MLNPGPRSGFFYACCNITPLKTYYLYSTNDYYLYHTRLFMTEKEYNECVTQYADNVYRFILKNLRHEEDARDVVQTAFEKMWRNRDDVDAAQKQVLSFYSGLSPDDRSYPESEADPTAGRIRGGVESGKQAGK
jgi:hypothetical protein